ncbi:hypothetical protein [Streptomyces sp. V4I8]|uniref:hypothetical protein n=1 Tax=Streptomyces sp. V4I8 TaxID=3156469 RepID=UPI0035181C0C
MLGECRPNRNGATFLAFLKKAVKPHTGKEIHIVLDSLSTHTTPDVKAWPAKNLVTRQSIRRGTFASVNVRPSVIACSRAPTTIRTRCSGHEILVKVRLVQTSVKKTRQ